MKIKAVLFDLGGTLEDLSSTKEQRREAAGCIRRVLATRSHAFDIPDEEFFEKLMAGYEGYKEYTRSLREKSPEEIWADCYLAAFPREREVVAAMADHLTELWETHFYVRSAKPEARPTLETLRAMGLKLGVITNTTSRSAPHLLLEKYDMMHLLDVVLTSAGEGCRKPGAELFLRAASFLDLEPETCIYVGDQVRKDMLGARAAGYGGTLLIDSAFTKIEGEDAGLISQRLDSLDQIPQWVARQNRE